MTLYEKIKTIYPELNEFDFMYRIVVRNDSDGNGDYIDVWNHPTLEQPTQEQLDEIE